MKKVMMILALVTSIVTVVGVGALDKLTQNED